MTVRDRCTDTNPHPAHRTQYGGFGLKDCPGVPMTRPEELREERVKTGRLEGNLRSQTRAARELTAERDAARQELGAAGDVLAVVWDAVERIERARAAYDTTPGEESPADDEDRQAAVQDLLDESTRAFAAADTSSERVEVIRDLLAGWYAHWPRTAVTDPHEPIAWQIASLISAAEARASPADVHLPA